MRILLANEPRSHWEVFAGALRALRPHLEVITVKPDALEGEVPRLRPDASTYDSDRPDSVLVPGVVLWLLSFLWVSLARGSCRACGGSRGRGAYGGLAGLLWMRRREGVPVGSGSSTLLIPGLLVVR